ncbi:MAG: N-acetyl sugar amidotransferase [Flavobacteriales bacterium]|nr:N-acetyl sugar amidotransferase [Flavobacteriales bacterium]
MQKLDKNNYIPRGVRLLEANATFCSRCVYDEYVPSIEFDENGVCNYCKMIDDIDAIFKAGTDEGEQEFLRIVEEIKIKGKGKKYDCVIGVSGGTDSSYMVIKAVELGLRPLAVHYDNTWNTEIATQNITKVLEKIGVDLYTYVVNNKEMDDIFKSFIKAGVPDLDSPTDLALAEVLYRVANKYGVKYILEGHSYKTEGVSPLGYNYIDGGYIKTVQKKFGSHKIKTYPLMDFYSFLKWVAFKRIKKIRPFWYIKYNKEDARAMLEEKYGWKYYGGHHLENRMTAFWQSYYMPLRFDIDQRNNSLSASVRSGFMKREDAIQSYTTAPYLEDDLYEYFLKRMGWTREQFDEVMNQPNKTFRDYKTYKQRFERFRFLFYILAKANLVPMSFYIKYTSKKEF